MGAEGKYKASYGCIWIVSWSPSNSRRSIWSSLVRTPYLGFFRLGGFLLYSPHAWAGVLDLFPLRRFVPFVFL